MCVVATKFIEGYGWVGAKNRDRNYKTEVHVCQSNRYGVQRLYIDDQRSRWTEGLNEYGLCILNAAFSVMYDEIEGDETESNVIKKKKKKKGTKYNEDGRKIRKALLEKDPYEAIKYLQSVELAGATYVFNEEDCYLMESGYNIDKSAETADNPRKFMSKIIKIDPKIGSSVRTNHGINITKLGYSKNSDDPKTQLNRKSSEMRRSYVMKELKKDFDNPHELMDALAVSPNEDTFLNPIRLGNYKKGEMVTTGQLLLIPKERTLHYRPILSTVKFQYDRISGPEAKTYFEIISSRKLLSFREWIEYK
jgi:hypothetical protein